MLIKVACRARIIYFVLCMHTVSKHVPLKWSLSSGDSSPLPGQVNLATVLSFTGEEIPPNGFGVVQPCLNFNNEQPYPTASTCAITLTLQQSTVIHIHLSKSQWILPWYAMVVLDLHNGFFFVHQSIMFYAV